MTEAAKQPGLLFRRAAGTAILDADQRVVVLLRGAPSDDLPVTASSLTGRGRTWQRPDWMLPALDRSSVSACRRAAVRRAERTSRSKSCALSSLYSAPRTAAHRRALQA